MNARVLDTFVKSDVIPVVAPVASGKNGETYNINADTMAGAIAAATQASRLLLLTDVPGVIGADKKLLTSLTAKEVKALIADGTISGGMIPKVTTCLDAVESGVAAAVILDGRVPHAILLGNLHRRRRRHAHRAALSPASGRPTAAGVRVSRRARDASPSRTDLRIIDTVLGVEDLFRT